MSKRFLYYCIAIKNHGIMHRFGNPVLFKTRNEAIWFLRSAEMKKWAEIACIEQKDLSVGIVSLNIVGGENE